MDALSDPPTEKEAIALRRWELLTELRSARRLSWRDYVDGIVKLLFPIWCFYQFSSQPVTRVTTCMLVLGAAWAVCTFAFFVINPMQRRIAALEKLLEDEVK